jgi:hypothetical protein
MIQDSQDVWVVGGDTIGVSVATVITSLGSFVTKQSNPAPTTLSVAPSNVGDLLVLGVEIYAAGGATVSSVSGGGVSSWTKIRAAQGSSNASDAELWMGKVTTAGAATITVAYSNAAHSTTLWCREFKMTGGTNTWTVDVSGSSNNPSSGTITFPTFTPTGSGELYVGVGLPINSATAGSTPGFTYDILPPYGDVAIFNPSCPASSVGATCPQSPAAASVAVAALIKAS